MEKTILTRLASRVINTPLTILPDKLNTILSVIGNRIGIDEQITLLKSDFEVSEKREDLSSPRLSVIPVHGSLVYRTQGLDTISGLTSYESIRKDFNAAFDEDTDAIVFDIDSSGGEASGLFDLVDEIYEARGEKPIYAVANESAYSAAYAIASAADKIFLSRSAGVGSVGVIAIHMDQSKLDENMGLKYTPIFAGARKNDFNPHQPLSTEAKSFLQDEVMELYEMFMDTVARNRGMTKSQIKATEAGLFTGEKAVSIGFADEVTPLSSAISSMTGGNSKNAVSHNSKINSKAKEVNTMDINELKEKHPELFQEITDSVRKTVTDELTDTFNQEKKKLEDEKKDFETKLNDQEKDNETLTDKVLKLEKADEIRTQNDLKRDAKAIWAEKLADSDIPKDLYDKVSAQVSYRKFIKDSVLDAEAFTKAVEAEIEDWEKKGVTETVIGTGFSSKDVETEETKNLKKESEEDDDAVKEMLELSGDVIASQT